MNIKYNIYKNPVDNENGSVLIMAILILAVLTIIGISASTTSTIETKIATNDMLYKTSFYAADGGTEVGIELVEQNIESAGFDSNILGKVAIETSKENFYLSDSPATVSPPVSDSSRVAYFPSSYTGNQPHTNLNIGGNPILSTGSSIQMAAGYAGKGKASGSGGTYMVYDIFSEYKGVHNSEVMITLQWRHGL